MGSLLKGGEPFLVGTRYSSAAFPPAERHDHWAARDWPAVAPLFDTVPQGAFAAESESFRLGALPLSLGTLTAQTYHRGPERLRDGVDHLAVSVRFAGAAFGETSNGSFAAPTGSIVLADLSRNHQHRSESSDTAQLMIPRALAEARIDSVRALDGLVIGPEAASLLRVHLLQLRRTIGSIPASQGERLGSTIVDLLAVAIAQARAQDIALPGAHDTALKVRVLQEIDARLGSATLTVADLARRLRVSRTTLYRLFEEEGGVQALIRARRLEQVRAALLDPADRTAIGDLAERWGFCDAAYLARVFRERYGLSPRDFRAHPD